MISISYRLLTRMGTILLGRAIGFGESASLSLGSVWLVVVLRFFELVFQRLFCLSSLFRELVVNWRGGYSSGVLLIPSHGRAFSPQAAVTRAGSRKLFVYFTHHTSALVAGHARQYRHVEFYCLSFR